MALEGLRGSYWFIPAVMALGAVTLAVLTAVIDVRLGSDGVVLALIASPSAEGARAVLTTIAGSMITVAGVTFSITIAAVAYTASQFAPRLLTKFMRDRGNQVTLGIFIAAFLYSVVILRLVADSGLGSETGFVPQVSGVVAILLGVAGIAGLIYYLHHIPESIDISNVIAEIGASLREMVEDGYPGLEHPEALPGPSVEHLGEPLGTVDAPRDGYVQYLDAEHLVRCAGDADLRLVVLAVPGDYVSEGRALARVFGASALEGSMASSIRSAFAIGKRRTPIQDIRFLAGELLEIAARALSPGVNDPFTAIACIDRLGSAVTEMAGRRDPPSALRDAAGAARVFVEPLGFARFASEVFARIRPYVAPDRNAALHALATIAEIAGTLRSEPQRAALREQTIALRDEASATLTSAVDRAAVEAAAGAALRRLASPPPIVRAA